MFQTLRLLINILKLILQPFQELVLVLFFGNLSVIQFLNYLPGLKLLPLLYSDLLQLT